MSKFTDIAIGKDKTKPGYMSSWVVSNMLVSTDGHRMHTESTPLTDCDFGMDRPDIIRAIPSNYSRILTMVLSREDVRTTVTLLKTIPTTARLCISPMDPMKISYRGAAFAIDIFPIVSVTHWEKELVMGINPNYLADVLTTMVPDRFRNLHIELALADKAAPIRFLNTSDQNTAIQTAYIMPVGLPNELE